ncbi:hypothetical protein K466DRAFT_668161 [Polyporus arcularius HHB13444]|uniref:AB hydrolase-1 domain-containing protein n=1 Tax=Polyporus arcularius HHB13444 TaxID=1314778 RepID=A0A5C3NTG6_9APHY|nr:hypothetical protein K466DRAFT_668161 [Polyporus arcularius HHB13444]
MSGSLYFILATVLAIMIIYVNAAPIPIDGGGDDVLGHNYNTRLVLVNRRDYPGSTQYSEEERALIAPLHEDARAEDFAKARENGLQFMANRAREVYGLLEDLVRREHIPPADRVMKTGGIVVAGWSYAGIWMQALLCYVHTFPVHDIDLSRYVRRVICYDVASVLSGYAPPAQDPYNPLFDPMLAEDEILGTFSLWVSGYFSHGDSPDMYERRRPLEHPPPTASTLRPDDLAACVYAPPGEAGGSDFNLMFSALSSGLFIGATSSCGGSWVLRNIQIVTIEKGNHFAHWDYPDWAMRALIGDEEVVR